MPPKASNPPEEMSFVRNTLYRSLGGMRVSRGHSAAPVPAVGTKALGRRGCTFRTSHSKQPHCPAVKGEAASAHGVAGAPLMHLILPSQPRCPMDGAGCGPATPNPAAAAAARQPPPPDYCWVSKKTLKSKEESCEEGHFSGSFSLFFFFLLLRRKLEKQSPQSRIERVTETG